MSSRKRSTSTPNQPSDEEEIKITTRKRRSKVQCFCNKCNGRLVDPRTKRLHEQKSASESTPAGEIQPPIRPIREPITDNPHLPITHETH